MLRKLLLPALLLPLLLSGGCRSWILEDRLSCPAWVNLKADPPVNGDNWAYLQLWLWKEAMDESEGLWVRADQLNEGLLLEWEKGTACQIAGLSGWTGKMKENRQLLIPDGSSCPDALGAYLGEKLEAEDAYRFPFNVKNLSANVLFELTGSGAEHLRPLLRGTVDGYCFPDLTLHTGPFHCEAEPREDGLLSARIPRQKDPVEGTSYSASLVAEILLPDPEAEPLYAFPLGSILQAGGYDWTAPHLDDIRIGVSLANGAIDQLSVQVATWKLVVIEQGQTLLAPKSEIAFCLSEPSAESTSPLKCAASAFPLQLQFRPMAQGLEAATKTAITTSLNAFYVMATTGAAGSENLVWGPTSFSGSSSYTGGKYWPDTDPSYHFYASNASFSFQTGGPTLQATNNMDVVCASLPNPSYCTANPLDFQHIFSRIGRVTVTAEAGISLSGVELLITPITGGTYHLRTGAWTSVSMGSPLSLAPSGEGHADPALLLVPGSYTLTAAWTASKNGRSVQISGQTAIVQLEAGQEYELALTLGGGQELRILPGVFSVSATKKVRFAAGNLEAILGEGSQNNVYPAASWQLAERQYSFPVSSNLNFTAGSLINLFCWAGSSATYDSYGLCYLPENPGNTSAYFGSNSSEGLKTDWGAVPGVVRDLGEGFFTLNTTQWRYLLFSRRNAASRMAWIHIYAPTYGTIHGLLLLPDSWTLPANCQLTNNISIQQNQGNVAAAADKENGFDDGLTSGENNAWCDMEAAGAVFLPFINDYRQEHTIIVGTFGCYWSSQTSPNSTSAYALEINHSHIQAGVTAEPRRRAHPVRLVVESH